MLVLSTSPNVTAVSSNEFGTKVLTETIRNYPRRVIAKCINARTDNPLGRVPTRPSYHLYRCCLR